jgi:hypothetical protein
MHGREQQSHQQADNADHYQQFDQGKADRSFSGLHDRSHSH